jgi:uroporphyrinogen decarboxylase
MAQMTSFERIKRMYEHREADRVPVIDYPWSSTIERWEKEGLPKGVSYVDHFDLERFAHIGADNSPQYPERLIEETPEYKTHTTKWGVTMRNWRHSGGVPEFLEFTITDEASWKKAKARMKPTRDRVNWEHLKANYPQWRREGNWISAGLWFGYDITHSFTVGTERVLTAMALEPEWMKDMFGHFLDVHIQLFDMIWDAGYHFDEVMWYDDMGYKNGTFFSLDMYRNLLRPFHKRAADWAHAKGCKVRLHSCGNIRAFIPDLIEIGIDMLNPVEVKAGLEPIGLKKEFGDRLGFHGGINAVLFEKPEELWKEMRRVIPAMKKDGGYIISSDHSVPEIVSFAEFTEFVRLAKELGTYE